MDTIESASEGGHDGQIHVEWEFDGASRCGVTVAGNLAAWELKQQLVRKLNDEEKNGLVIWFSGKEVYRWRLGMTVGGECRPLENYSFGPKIVDEHD